jgi:hypothetical protein
MLITREQLKSLTTPQLKRLEKILELMEGGVACSFDELLERLATKQPLLSNEDSELIGARTYALVIYDHLDTATALAQAQQEFDSGKLKHKIKRYRPKEKRPPVAPLNPVLALQPPVPTNVPATLAAVAVPPAFAIPTPQPLPDNVIPFCHPKVFYGENDENNSVW